MASFISPLPPRHPYRLIFEPFLARDRNQFSTGLTNILGSVMTDPRKSYDAATGSETIREYRNDINLGLLGSCTWY